MFEKERRRDKERKDREKKELLVNFSLDNAKLTTV